MEESNNEKATLKKFEELKEKLAREKDLEKAIKENDDLTIRNTPFFSKSESIPGIGNIEEIKEKSFSMKVGDFSSAKIRNRYYLYKLSDIEKAGEPNTEEAKEITNQIKMEKSRQAFNEWVENLKTRATILVDKTLL